MNKVIIDFICELEIIYRKYNGDFIAYNPKYNLKGRSNINYESALNDLFDKIKIKIWTDESYKVEYRLKENFQIDKTETVFKDVINN